MAEKTGRARPRRAAVVAGDGALGAEVRRLLGEPPWSALDLKLYSSAERPPAADSDDVEPLASLPLEALSVDGIDLAFVCEPASGFTGIAASGALFAWLGEQPGVTGAGAPRLVAGVNSGGPARSFVSPDPMTVVLATLIEALRPWEPTRVEAVFELPGIRLGRPGLEELHAQTVSLLNFSKQPREVFGRQQTFNLFPLPGAGAAVEAELAEVLGDDLPPVGVSALSGPLFMALAGLVTVELAEDLSRTDLEAALAGAHRVRVCDPADAPGPAEILEEQADDIVVSVVAGPPGPIRLWCTADLLRRTIVRNALDVFASGLVGME